MVKIFFRSLLIILTTVGVVGLIACTSSSNGTVSYQQLNGKSSKGIQRGKPKLNSKKPRGATPIALQWPAEGLIVPHAKSVDIASRAGTPIKAAGDGMVVYSGRGLKQYGNLLIIKHNEDFLTVYAHNRELKVKEGERVTKGQIIALMGNSAAERVKLHFEVRVQGKPQDPLKFLPKI
jgi:lipoprotein NlpD